MCSSDLLLGLIVSVIALRDLARPETLKVGRLAAIAGLALSIGFGSQATVSRLAARQIIAARAVQAATIWLEAIREERLLDARGMMSPAIVPAVEYLGTHEDAPAVNDPVAYEPAMRQLRSIKAISECGKAAAIVRCTGYTPESQESRETWTARIRLAPCDDGDSRELELALQQTLRAAEGGRVERWEVTRVELVGPANPGR